MAVADSMRCGTRLVERGETKAEVTLKCGKPAAIDSCCRDEYIKGRGEYTVVCHPVDLWSFDLGAGNFLMQVEFEQGKVTRITSGERVQ